MDAGGTVVATGPTGHYDERANPMARAWLADFGVPVELSDPSRPGGFPPYKHFQPPVEVAQCRVPDSFRRQMKEGWFALKVGRGRLVWRPERISQKNAAEAVIHLLQLREGLTVRIRGLPADWRVRQFRDGSRRLVHALPGKVEAVLHPTLKNQISNQRIIQSLTFASLSDELVLQSPEVFNRVTLHSPDLAAARQGKLAAPGAWGLDATQVRRYFVLECVA